MTKKGVPRNTGPSVRMGIETLPPALRSGYVPRV